MTSKNLFISVNFSFIMTILKEFLSPFFCVVAMHKMPNKQWNNANNPRICMIKIALHEIAIASNSILYTRNYFRQPKQTEITIGWQCFFVFCTGASAQTTEKCHKLNLWSVALLRKQSKLIWIMMDIRPYNFTLLEQNWTNELSDFVCCGERIFTTLMYRVLREAITIFRGHFVQPSPSNHSSPLAKLSWSGGKSIPVH